MSAWFVPERGARPFNGRKRLNRRLTLTVAGRLRGVAEREPRADRNDSRRTDVRMTHIVMAPDAVDIDRRDDARKPIESFQITRQMREILYAIAIALEVPVVDRIETAQRRKQPPVGFRGC